MSKVRKTVSISPELARIVDRRDEFNLSGFVESCLEQHFAGDNAGNPELAALRAEMEELEEELDDLEQTREQLHARRREIEERLEDAQDREPELLDRASEALQATPKEPDNPAVQNWAAKVGISPRELCERLTDDNEKTETAPGGDA